MNILLKTYLLGCLIGLCFSLQSLSAQIQSNKQLRQNLLEKKAEAPVDSIVAHYLELEGIPLRKHNRLTLLPSGTEKFQDLFSHIRQAKEHIHMEYFNFRNDSISHSLFRLLGEKVREGVDVRILFDAFGNMSNDSPLKNRHLDSLRGEGVQIVKFDPIRFPWVNHVAQRDHRKLAIIDGVIAYIGGMNIADYYITGLKEVGAWRDMHCRIEGEAVADIQRIFLSMWQKATKEELSDTLRYLKPNIISTDTLNLSIVDRSNRKQPDAIKDAYALSISGAKKRVYIVNPYFVPTSAIMSSIKKALKSGIEVHIMVSEKSDIPFTPEAMLHKLRKLSKKGAKVYLYTGGFLHAKVMTVDGTLSTVGSANLNSRSLRYDYETNVFIFDKKVTATLDSIYSEYQSESIPLDDNYWKRRSLWKKFVGWFANLFTPFL